MRLFSVILFVVAASMVGVAQQASLYDQFAQQRLRTEFNNPGLSYQLVDVANGRVVTSQWESPERPIAIGSLAKPFAALAYASKHSEFPHFVCRGKADRCWLPRGHGRLSITQAIAQSCNAYFRKLVRQLAREDLDAVIARYGLGPLAADAPRDSYFGMSDSWKMTPQQLTDGYRLLATTNDPGAVLVRSGMEQSSRVGTGRGLRNTGPVGVLVKTGTAPCAHASGGAGDGLAVVLFPADRPRSLLLVRLHNAPGAKSAEVAARMIAALSEGANASH